MALNMIIITITINASRNMTICSN